MKNTLKYCIVNCKCFSKKDYYLNKKSYWFKKCKRSNKNNIIIIKLCRVKILITKILYDRGQMNILILIKLKITRQGIKPKIYRLACQSSVNYMASGFRCRAAEFQNKGLHQQII